MSKVPDYTNPRDLHSLILNNSMNLGRAQAAVIHKKQMLMRIKIYSGCCAVQQHGRCRHHGGILGSYRGVM